MINFHRFLIGTAIVFSAAFAVWAIVAYRANGGGILLFLGIFFAIATVAMSYYLKNLERFLRR